MSKLRKYVSRIPILDLRKQVRIIRNEQVNNSARAFVGISFLISVCYFVFPVDIIPDILLGLGYMDDLALYAFLREVGYQAADNDCGVVEASKITFRSKVLKVLTLVFGIITICILILTYFLI